MLEARDFPHRRGYGDLPDARCGKPQRAVHHSQFGRSAVYRSYIKGIKTGSTQAAGRNFVSAAVNDKGETYIGVVLGAPWDAAEDGYAYSFHDTATIYDWLFANYSIKPSIDTGSPVTEVKVNYSSEADTLMLYPAGDLKTVLPNDSDELLEKTFDVPESVDAPIAMGDKVGTVTLTLNGALVGAVDLIAGQDVARNGFLYAVSRVQAFFGGLYFRMYPDGHLSCGIRPADVLDVQPAEAAARPPRGRPGQCAPRSAARPASLSRARRSASCGKALRLPSPQLRAGRA